MEDEALQLVDSEPRVRDKELGALHLVKSEGGLVMIRSERVELMKVALIEAIKVEFGVI